MKNSSSWVPHLLFLVLASYTIIFFKLTMHQRCLDQIEATKMIYFVNIYLHACTVLCCLCAFFVHSWPKLPLLKTVSEDSRKIYHAKMILCPASRPDGREKLQRHQRCREEDEDIERRMKHLLKYQQNKSIRGDTNCHQLNNDDGKKRLRLLRVCVILKSLLIQIQ